MAETALSASDAGATAAPELTLTRTFDAPRALVFKAWTQPEHLVRWLGPEGFQGHSIRLDPKPGGSWRACIDSPEGEANWMGGIYHVVEPPERLAFTFAWDSTGFETLVTITLAEIAGKTTMTFHQAPFASIDSRDSHAGGWRSSFDRLARYLPEVAR